MSELDALREELARLEQYKHPRAEHVRAALAAAEPKTSAKARAAAKADTDDEVETATPHAPTERAVPRGKH